MTRKGENIYKRKDGRWEGRYICRTADGKKKYGYVYGHSYRETKNKKLEAEKNAVEAAVSSADFSALLELWLEYKRFFVKESTYVRYRSLIKNHLKPVFGSYEINQINQLLISEKLGYFLKEGRQDKTGGLSPKTVRDLFTLMHSVINYSVQIGYHCPAWKNVRIASEPREISVLTEQEQKQLTDYLLNHLDTVSLGILLSLCTGLRIGEVCALRWENIDFSAGMLCVTETMQRLQYPEPKPGCPRTHICFTAPKSFSSKRQIPLPESLLSLLKNFSKPGSYFLLSGNPDHFLEPRTMENKFRRIMSELNITGATFHTLRHTFATRCVEAGFELKSLSEILGHSSVNITLNRYVHSSFQLKQKNMEQANPFTYAISLCNNSAIISPRETSAEDFRKGNTLRKIS